MSVFRSLLMLSAVAPEPDIYPYLLAGRSGNKFIKLMASKTDAIYYNNIPYTPNNIELIDHIHYLFDVDIFFLFVFAIELTH